MSSSEEIIQNAQQEAKNLAQISESVNQTKQTGPKIDGYTVESLLHQGAQGIVYRGSRNSDGMSVAIKLHHRRFIGTDDPGRYLREVKLLQELKIPSVVEIFDFGQIDGLEYLVMPLIGGKALDYYVDSADVSLEKKLNIFAEVVAGVQQIHARGVIHRDLKPSNIMVNDDGSIRLIDFGLAAYKFDSPTDHALTQSGLFIGSMPWASPEHMEGDSSQIDVRSDIYSLGVILYQLITGVFPYVVDAGLIQILESIRETAPDRPRSIDSSLDKDLETITLKCLSKEPERRYQTAESLASDLSQYKHGNPIEARRDSALYLLRHVVKRHRWAAALAIACCIGGYIFGAYASIQSRRAVVIAAQANEQRAKAQASMAFALSEKMALQAKVTALTDATNQSRSWTDAFHNARVIGKLPAGEAFQAMKKTWDGLETSDAKQQFLKAISSSHSPDQHLGLHLGVLDSSPKVNSWACTYLREITLTDPATDRDGYLAWYEEHKSMTTQEAMGASLRRIADAVRNKVEAKRWKEAGDALGILGDSVARVQLRGNAIREIVDETQFADSLLALALRPALGEPQEGGNAKPAKLGKGIGILRDLPLSESFVKERIVPLLESHPGSAGAIVAIIAKHKKPWSLSILTNEFRRQLATDPARNINSLAIAMAEFDDPSVIPLMIAAIKAENTYETVYGVGYFGLSNLTGVQYDEKHDGEWWLKWWEENKSRYDIPDKDLPTLMVGEPKSRSREPRDAFAWHVEGNEQARYTVHTPHHTSHKDRVRALFVLPGGDGSSDFTPFVNSIARKCTEDGWIVVQLIARKWDDKQFDNIVWPTTKNPYKAMEYSTDEYMRLVIDDLEKKFENTIDFDSDKNDVYVLAWSSGGPAAYELSLSKDLPIKGCFAAMSVFGAADLSPLEGAKDKRFYVLHSPEDFIPMKHPKDAVEKLKAAGATTKLTTYEGGHGWHGDAFAMIKSGLDWLESE